MVSYMYTNGNQMVLSVQMGSRAPLGIFLLSGGVRKWNQILLVCRVLQSVRLRDLS